MSEIIPPVYSGYSNDDVFEYGWDIHPTFPDNSHGPYALSRPSLQPTMLSPYDDNTLSKEEGKIQESSSPSIRVYKRRYYVLLVYSLMLFYQGVKWNTWGLISASAMEAFPDWTDATVATLATLRPITAALFVVPTSWAVANFAHICGILNGIEYTLILAGATLPAVWFPAQQRITATAFSSALNTLGSAGSLIQPLTVRAPGNDTSVEEIKEDIRTLMFIEMGPAVMLFLAVLVYFPSSPPTPPSPSSQVERYNFSDSYRKIIKNPQFLQLIIPYGFYTSVVAVWMSVIDFYLQELSINQNEAVSIGVYAGVCSSLLTLVISRLADVFYGHLKIALFVLMTLSSVFFIWFMLLTLGVIPFTKVQVYITVLGGPACNFACGPLFFEACVETVFPSPESGVLAIATLLNNLVAAVFFFLFYLPGISGDGYKWMTYALVATNVVAIPPVMLTKFEYKRSKLDRKELAE